MVAAVCRNSRKDLEAIDEKAYCKTSFKLFEEVQNLIRKETGDTVTDINHKQSFLA